MSKSRTGAEDRALERILSSPELARLVPTLPADVLHRAIEKRGLEDAGELLALATPAQLRELADLDLWRAARPGETGALDADRFATWLDVLVDTDPARAAARLVDLDRDLVTIGLARHVRVFDHAAIAEFETTDGHLVASRRPQDCQTAEIGGFVIAARGSDAWDAIVTVLAHLDTDHPDVFREVMRGVCALSNSDPEADGLDSLSGVGDQLQHDVRTEREERREEKGFVTVADARAFLQAARNSRIDATVVPASGPVIIARESSRALVAVPAQGSARLKWMRDQMGHLADYHPGVYASRNGDLTWLANALIAGCSIQGRAFTAQEAWDAAVATCNLALERLTAPANFLVDHDLIRVFQAGWTILHDDVIMRAADELGGALARLRSRDAFVQADINALGRELTTHLRAGAPWHARKHMDVLAVVDTIAWTGLLGLVAEYPVRPAAVSAARKGMMTVSPSAFELISEQAMIDEIQTFLAALPEWFRDDART